MTRSEEITLADQYIELFDAGMLTEKKNLIFALSLKWFRLNVLYKIKDKRGKIIRFRANWAQRQFYLNQHGRDLILKARQLGFTTFKMLCSLDSTIFVESFASGCIAHKLSDATDIYENKIRFGFKNITSTWRAIFEEVGLNFPKPVNDKGGAYKFDNDSTIQVSTSYRGGTLQDLHVSEFGKICKQYPEKAREIVTGALEAVPIDGNVTFESTAEGNEGYFFTYCQEALRAEEQGQALTALDFKMHFFPWFDDPEYKLDPKGVVLSHEWQKYFNKLEDQLNIRLSAGQRAWYVKKESKLLDDMKREYPSTPKEAFEQAIDGAYYARQMTDIRKNGRIRKVTYDPRLPVYTFWDLGRNDATAIWFMQYVHGEYRFIRYYENSGESIQFYLKQLREFEYVYSTIYLPHDAEVTDLTRADNKSRKQIVEDAGFEVKVVPRVPEKAEAIQAVRDILPLCWFDEENTEQGIKCLDHYRKEWDDKRGAFKDRPKHDWSSHGNDGFEQFARGFAEDMEEESFEPEN